jgi:Tfp pilus assembly protein PilN
VINLLPDDLKTERQFGRRNRLLFGYGLSIIFSAMFIAAIMLVSLGFVGSGENKLKEEIESIKQQNAILSQQQQAVEKLVANLETVDKLYESGVKFSELIPGIAGLLPKGTVLNALSLTGGKTDPLQLDVDMENQNLASVLVQNLTSSELFEAADVSSINSKGSDENSTYGFSASISVSFKGSAEAKKKAKAAADAQAKAAQEATANSSGGSQ